MIVHKIIRGLSANTIQLLVNQIFGFVIFFLLSRALSKSNFGELNWTLALLLTIFNLLSFGIDQMMVKKIAGGGNVSILVSLYALHTFFSGGLFYVLLLIAKFIFPEFFIQHTFLLLLGIGKLLIFFSAPYKQLVTGLQKFDLLLFMSVGSNVVRGLGLLIISLNGAIRIHEVIVIFIAGDAFELLVCIAINKSILKSRTTLPGPKREYINLLRESLPQIGVVIFTSAIARFDWIFIGLFVSDVKLAEYSFAYKIFEISTLPLLAIAPLLVPFFTIFFLKKREENPESVKKINFLVRMEMIVAGLSAMMVNLLWIPIIDPLTQGKYGLVNKYTVFILTLSIPAIYLNNILWSINFAIGKLRPIFFVFGISFAVNILGDVGLIPFLKNEGAAGAFILSVFIQMLLFYRITDQFWMKSSWKPLLACLACAFGSLFLSRYLFTSRWVVFLFATISYFFFLAVAHQIKRSDYKEFRKLFKNSLS